MKIKFIFFDKEFDFLEQTNKTQKESIMKRVFKKEKKGKNMIMKFQSKQVINLQCIRGGENPPPTGNGGVDYPN